MNIELKTRDWERSLLHLNQKYSLETAWNHKTCLEVDFAKKMDDYIFDYYKVYNNEEAYLENCLSKINDMKNNLSRLSIELFDKSIKQTFNEVNHDLSVGDYEKENLRWISYDGYQEKTSFDENEEQMIDDWGNNLPKDHKYRDYKIYWYGDPGCWRPMIFILGECFDTYEDNNLLFRCVLAIIELLGDIKRTLMCYVADKQRNSEE